MALLLDKHTLVWMEEDPRESDPLPANASWKLSRLATLVCHRSAFGRLELRHEKPS